MAAKKHREILVDSCRKLRAFLEMTLSDHMRQPELVELYQDRWLRLDAVLEEFQRDPSNFDSRFGVGLAERIHRAEPTKMLEGTDRAYFTLKPPEYAKGRFGSHDLASILEEAYRRKGFGDTPVAGFDVYGEYYDQTEPDLICSELNNYFNGLSKELRRHEEDQALAANRKDTKFGSREDYEQEAIDRANDRDPYTENLFARKCCEYCFRLIPERSGKTKTTIGKTCTLHDSTINPSLYHSARARHLTQQKNLEEQRMNGKVDVENNADNPELVPWRLHVHMTSALLNKTYVQILDEGLFSLTQRVFLSERKKTVDTNMLNDLLDHVRYEFPEIARPNQFATRIQSFIEKSKHTPEQLFRVFGWFFFDADIPLHPTIIATYMRMFLEESWFAQKYAPDYYGSDRGKGRPKKIDPIAVIEAAEMIKQENPQIGSKLSATLGKMFSCTPTRIRQILKKEETA